MGTPFCKAMEGTLLQIHYSIRKGSLQARAGVFAFLHKYFYRVFVDAFCGMLHPFYANKKDEAFSSFLI
jgi:hypothetical protein